MLRVSNSMHYPLRWQHDGNVHLGYLEHLAHFEVPRTYNAPWYYVLICLVAAPVIAASKLLGCSNDCVATLAVGSANTIFFTVFLVGMWALSFELSFCRLDAAMVAVLAVSFPVVQRTFNMVRPENLILTLFPWALCLLIRHLRDCPSPQWLSWRFWAAGASLALCASQKLGGLTVVAGAALVATAVAPGTRRERVARIAPPLVLACLLAVALVAIQSQLSGASPLVHDADQRSGFTLPPAGFYGIPDLETIWVAPLRNELRASMFAILIADMYGDYWQFGYDVGPAKRPREDSICRGRFGLVLAASFSFLLLWALWILGRGVTASDASTRAIARLRVCCVVPGGLGLLYLATAAQKFYSPADGDIVKWEYISWFFPCAAIVLGGLPEQCSKKGGTAVRAAIAILICGGLLQSVIW